MRITAGSTSVRAFEQPLREAGGGRARDAGRRRRRPLECRRERMRGAPTASSSTAASSFGFGELAEEAAACSPPRRPALRQRHAARLIGKPLPRLDAPAKADGSLRFAGDVRLPDMLFASARLAPPGGKLEALRPRRGRRHARGVRHLAATRSLDRGRRRQLVGRPSARCTPPIRASPARRGATTSGALFDERARRRATSTTLFERGDYDAAVEGSRPLAATYCVAPTPASGARAADARPRAIRGGAARSLGGDPGAGPRARAAARRRRHVLSDAGRASRRGARWKPTRCRSRSTSPARPGGRCRSPCRKRAAQNHDRSSPGALIRMTALPGAGGITAALADATSSTADGMAAALARLAAADAPATLGEPRSTARSRLMRFPHLSRRRGARSRCRSPSATCAARREREAASRPKASSTSWRAPPGSSRSAFRMALLGGNGAARALLPGRGAARAVGRRRRRAAAWASPALGLRLAHRPGRRARRSAPTSGSQVDQLVCAVDCGRIVNPGLVRQQVEGALIWALGQATVAGARMASPAMPRRPAARRDSACRGSPTLPKIDVAADPEQRRRRAASAGSARLPLAPAVANAIFAATGRRMREPAVRSYGGGMSRPPDHPDIPEPRIGVLLINLGTPDAPDAPSVQALPRRIPQRPARDRNPAMRVAADPARDHPQHPAGEERACLPASVDRAGLAARRDHAAPGRGAAAAARRRRPGRFRDALRQSGHRRRCCDAMKDAGLRAHPARAALSAILRGDDGDRQRRARSPRWRRCAGSRRCARCRLIMTIRSTSARCKDDLERQLAALDFAPRTPAAQLPRHAAADARARRSLSLPLPEDRAAAGRGAGRARSTSPSSRASAAPNGSSPRPTRCSRPIPAQGVDASRHRRARLLRRLPRDAGRARHPRPRRLSSPPAARISRGSTASTIQREGMAHARTRWSAANLQAGCRRLSAATDRNRERDHGSSGDRHRRNARHRRSDQHRAQGHGHEGRGQLCRQRRARARIHRAHRHRGVQMGRRRLSTPARTACARSRPSSARSTCWSTMPASPATRR